jgi:uncharacterized protein (DUF2267 family)
MKQTGLDVLDSTIQRTNVWLNELAHELNWLDRRKTFLALRCVLHAVRDRLSVEDAAYVGEQFPTLIRGVYYGRWEPRGKPIAWRSDEDFVAVVHSSMEQDGGDIIVTEKVIRAVFRLLDRKATEGEIQDIRRVLPSGMQDLWPPALRAA